MPNYVHDAPRSITATTGKATMTRHLTKLDLATGQPMDADSAFLDPAEAAARLTAAQLFTTEVDDEEPLVMVPLEEDTESFEGMRGETWAQDDGPADEPDLIDQPEHYTSHPSGVECIEVTEHMTFCLGNAVKYIWRAGLKGDRIEDLRKAAWYLDREIGRLSGVLYRQAVLGEET